MDIKTKSRDYLKGRFKKNAIPTETDFADLIEAAVNQKDDGLARPAGEPLSLQAADGGNRPVLKLYESFSEATPAWALSLSDGNAVRVRKALVVGDGAGNPRLSIDHATGAVQVGALTATGTLTAGGGLTVPAGVGLTVTEQIAAGALLVTGPRTRLEGVDPTGCHVILAGRAREPASSALAFHVAEKRVLLGPSWTLGAADNTLEVSASVTMTGTDLQIDNLARRGTAAGQHRRALVHAPGDVLNVNYEGDYTGGVKIRGIVDAPDGLQVGSASRAAHLEADGSFYRYGGQVYLTVDDNLYVRDSGAAATATAFHFDTNNARLGVGKASPERALDVVGDVWASGNLAVGGITFNGNMRDKDGMVEIGIRSHLTAKDPQGNSYRYAVLHVKGLVLTNHVKASGKITAGQLVVHGAKQFQIDHPLEPKGKTLAHAALEGPEVGVYYRGEGQLTDGRAVLALPTYFEALTRNEGRTVMITPRYEGDEPVSALAATGITGGRFAVRAIDPHNPSQRFYWEIKAVRADLPALEVERVKKGTSVTAPAVLDAE